MMGQCSSYNINRQCKIMNALDVCSIFWLPDRLMQAAEFEAATATISSMPTRL